MPRTTQKERLVTLRAKLRAIAVRQAEQGFREDDHLEADEALLAYIGDAEVSAAYEDIERLYA